MKTGKRWSSWKFFPAIFLALPGLLCAPGCAKDRASVGKNLMNQQSAERQAGVIDNYRVACPDVIELVVAERPDFNGKYEIGVEGVLNLGDYGKLRIEGRTPPDIAMLLAAETGASQESIKVRIVEFRSQHVLLFGEVVGKQRSVPYHGQETVLDLLQRVGGLTPGAEPTDVFVVRPHVGDNKRAEVFHVDLRAIVMKQDHKTNIRVLPFDQVFVGETRQARIENAIPPWMQAIYRAVWHTTAAGSGQPAAGSKAD